MPTAAEQYLYTNNKELIRILKKNTRVFINGNADYWCDNKKRLNKHMCNVFDTPFDEDVSVIEDGHCIIFYDKHVKDNKFEATFVVISDDIAYLGNICLWDAMPPSTICPHSSYILKATENHAGKVYTAAMFEEVESGYLSIEITFNINRIYRIGDTYVTTAKHCDINHVFVRGKSMKDVVWLPILNTIAYFYELIGDEFEVRNLSGDSKPSNRKEVTTDEDQIFVVLRKKKITIEDTGGRSQIEHEHRARGPLEYGYDRREHKRTFRHPRYTKMRGKTITIDKTHCGPDRTKEKVYKIVKA